MIITHCCIAVPLLPGLLGGTTYQSPAYSGKKMQGPQILAPRPADKPIPRSPGMDQLNAVLKGQTLTIDDAIRIALAISKSVAQAKANLYVAEGKTQEAYSALNPTIGSIVSALRLNEEQTTTTLVSPDPNSLSSPIGKKVAVQNIQQQTVFLGAVMPVDISGTLNAGAEQAKYLRLQYELDVNRTENDVVTQVKIAFYAVLRARALRKVADDNLANSQIRLKDAQNKLAAKVVTRFDVLRAQVDVANAQQELITAKNNVESLYAGLNNAIGVQVYTRLHATEAGAVQEPSATEAIPRSAASAVSESAKVNPEIRGADANLGAEFQADLAEALHERPEIKEAAAGVSSADWGVRYAERTDAPFLDLSAGYLYAPNAGGLHPYTHTWQLGAQLGIPVFDGGLAAARVKEAKGGVATAENQERVAEDQVTLEVEQAYLAVVQARDRVQVANQTLSEAQDAFAIAQRRYNAAVSPLIELSDAQTALTQAQSNQVNALYDYNSATALLDRAMGRYSEYEVKR